MVIQLAFTEHPPQTGGQVHGVSDSDAVTEMAALFKITSQMLINGNIILQMPDQKKLSWLVIHNAEAKNIFNANIGKQLYISEPRYDGNARPATKLKVP